MSTGSHFTCRCVTPEPFSGKVRFNLAEKQKEGRRGVWGTLRGIWDGGRGKIRMSEFAQLVSVLPMLYVSLSIFLLFPKTLLWNAKLC